MTFADALLAGAPADGGAYVPTKVPTMDISRVLDRASFEDVCVEVLSPFVDSVFDREDVRGIAREVVSRYEGKEVCNVRRLGRRGGREARVAELFRGPTLSAEDASMRMTMRMLDRVLARKNKRANVVCCSTGEAGGGLASVAAEMTRVDAWIAYPGDDGDVSEPQEREMTCHVEDNVHPIKVFECPDGVSDVDAVVSDVFADEQFRMAHGLVSANSSNIARVLSYVPIFFYIYAQVRSREQDRGKPVVFTVPSSTFALEFAGSLARMMGLPITIVAACNANGAAHRVISMGELYKTDMVHTSSSALDVVVAENVWRSLYYAAGSNPMILSELQDDFDEDGEVVLPPKMARELNTIFKSALIDDDLLFSVIQHEERLGFVPCPQTALAIAAIEMIRDVPEDVPAVALAVSHPSKFPDVIRRAVPQLSNGASHPTVEAMTGLFHRRRTCTLEEFERSLRRDIAAVTAMRTPEPVRVERLLLEREDYERLYASVLRKTTKRGKILDNPFVNVFLALMISFWATATTPPRDASRSRERDAQKAEAKAKRDEERVRVREARALEKQRAREISARAKADARTAREMARAARAEEKRARAGAPTKPHVMHAYARDRDDARPPNEHFAHEPNRTLR